MVAIILNLHLSANRLGEIYRLSLHSNEQKILRELGESFAKHIKEQRIIFVMAAELVREKQPDVNQPVVYSVLVGREGIKSNWTINFAGIKYYEFNLRNLQSDDEIIGLGLAVLNQVQSNLLSQSNDRYSFTDPRIKYAIMPPNSPEFWQYAKELLGPDYALELSFEATKNSKPNLNDW